MPALHTIISKYVNCEYSSQQAKRKLIKQVVLRYVPLLSVSNSGFSKPKTQFFLLYFTTRNPVFQNLKPGFYKKKNFSVTQEYQLRFKYPQAVACEIELWKSEKHQQC